MDGPITADCFGPLIVTGAGGAAGVALGDGIRIGSRCWADEVGSVLCLFHTMGSSFG